MVEVFQFKVSHRKGNVHSYVKQILVLSLLLIVYIVVVVVVVDFVVVVVVVIGVVVVEAETLFLRFFQSLILKFEHKKHFY